MQRRTVGLGLMGLGAFLLAGALAVQLFLVPTMVRLPLDQQSAVTVSDENATYLDRSALRVREGLVTVNLRVQGDAGDAEATDDVAVWYSGTTITDGRGELITDPSETINCIDRRNAEAVDCDVRSADIEGLTLTFPFDTEKQDYDVWNGNAGQTFPARYVGEEEINGVDVYRFEISIPETVIDESQVPSRIAGGGSNTMVTAEVVYSSERQILVEPVSGKIVSSVEQPTIFLRGPGGATGATVLQADLGPDEATLQANAADAADTRDEIRLISVIVPWSMVALGLILAAVGVVLFLMSRGSGAHRDEYVEAPPMASTAS